MKRHYCDGLVAMTARCASTQSSATSTTAETTAEATTPSLTYAGSGTHAVGYREFTTTGAQEQPLTVRA